MIDVSLCLWHEREARREFENQHASTQTQPDWCKCIDFHSCKSTSSVLFDLLTTSIGNALSSIIWLNFHHFFLVYCRMTLLSSDERAVCIKSGHFWLSFHSRSSWSRRAWSVSSNHSALVSELLSHSEPPPRLSYNRSIIQPPSATGLSNLLRWSTVIDSYWWLKMMQSNRRSRLTWNNENTRVNTYINSLLAHSSTENSSFLAKL